MNAVSNLVFNALAQYEGIRLPGIGSLSVVCIPALIDEKGDIVPPNNKVVYLKEEPENLTSIIDLIERSAGSDQGKAEDLYRKWIDNMRDEEGGIAIERTGEIRHDIFTVYPELEAILNPTGVDYAAATEKPSHKKAVFEKSVPPMPASAKEAFTEKAATKPAVLTKTESTKVKVNTNTIMILIVVGVLLGAGIVFGFLYMRGQNYKLNSWRSNTTATAAVAPAKSAVPSTLLPTDTVRQESAFSVQAGPSGDESRLTPQDQKISPASQGQQTPSVSSPQNDEDVAPASAPAKGEKIYYVVAGVFSLDSNADRFIVQSQAKAGIVRFAKIPWKGKVLVSAYTSSSRNEAEQMRKKLSSQLSELWVHEETGR